MNTMPAGMEMLHSAQQLESFIKDVLPVLATIGIIATICLIAFAVLMISATWCVFRKAGTGGWKSLIPVYSDYTFYKIAWKRRYFFIVILLVFLGSIATTMTEYFPEYSLILYAVSAVLSIIAVIIDIKSIVKLAKVFGMGGGFAVGLIFLPFIFLPILGFGKAKYRRGKRRKKKALPSPESV